MNLFVADPEWGWWIVLYFYLGGIAAGAYFAATLIDLCGGEIDRDLARIGYTIPPPLLALCGLFLIVDLNRPERFWHMLFRSETVHEALQQGWPQTAGSWQLMSQAPLLKFWSPMSIGAWALSVFGLCSALSLLGSLWSEGRLARLLRRGLTGTALAVLGTLGGFFVAAYTGALLTATNQPLWSDSVWIAPLFLTSAASTGLATLILLARWRGDIDAESLERLARADLWALGLELIVFAIFLVSLGPYLEPIIGTLHGKVFLAGTLVLGVLAPLGLHLGGNRAPRRVLTAAALSLLGGFILRYGILTTPVELLERGPATSWQKTENREPRTENGE